MESQDNKLSCKVIIVGDSGVGKTCLMNRFCRESFPTSCSTTVEMNIEHKDVKVCDEVVKLTLWDTVGQEKFFSLTKSYFRHAMAVLFVYDVTREKTLFDIHKWFKIVEEEGPPDIIKILVGNKCDKFDSKQVLLEDGQAVAEYYNMLFCEVSSKENINVSYVFCLISKMSLEKLHKNNNDGLQHSSDVVLLTNTETPVNDSNCFVSSIYDWLYDLF